jgi:hypothetical protein
VKENSIKNEQSFIKEAVKTMEHWIEYEKNNKEKINRADELINIQETILSDYKRILKENEELKNDYENLSNSVVVKNYCIKNSIPIQKVKDKIRHYQELQDNYIKKYDEINEGLQAMINVLQELLEGRK